MTEPLLTGSRFHLDFAVDGPAFPRPFDTGALMKPWSVRAEVVLELGEPVVKVLRVYGHRAKKDGSASKTAMQDDWYPRVRYQGQPPDYILAVGTEAVRLVNGMLSASGEVTV